MVFGKTTVWMVLRADEVVLKSCQFIQLVYKLCSFFLPMHAQRAIPFQAIMGHLGVSRALAAFHFFHGSLHFFRGSNWRVPLFPWGIPLFSRRKAERKVERGFCLKPLKNVDFSIKRSDSTFPAGVPLFSARPGQNTCGSAQHGIREPADKR